MRDSGFDPGDGLYVSTVVHPTSSIAHPHFWDRVRSVLISVITHAYLLCLPKPYPPPPPSPPPPLPPFLHTKLKDRVAACLRVKTYTFKRRKVLSLSLANPAVSHLRQFCDSNLSFFATNLQPAWRQSFCLEKLSGRTGVYRRKHSKCFLAFFRFLEFPVRFLAPVSLLLIKLTPSGVGCADSPLCRMC